MSLETIDRIGTSLGNDRYEIHTHIGTGSMGHVYRAFDTRLETDVCVKIPTVSRLSDPDYARRFEQESRFLVRLSHPQVVNIIDVGIEEQTPYIVMQYVGGGTLLDRMQDANGKLHPRPVKDLKHWLPGVAKALDFMHSRDCIHRDVKPANILFDDYNNAYLSDFGLSKLLADDETPDDNRMTAKGAVVGTPNYIAPEIVLGEEYHGRADQYSLAITVYEFLTGKAPLEGPSASATMVNQTNKQPPPLTKFCPKIPVRLNAVVLKALSKEPEKRFQSCEKFADAVMDSLTGGPTNNRNGSASASSSHWQSGSTSVGMVPKHIVTDKSKAISPGKIPCPKCQKKLIVNSEHAGLSANCSGCDSRLLISTDVEELSLLELNPDFNPRLHSDGKHELDQVSTVLKPVVFGRTLSEREATFLVIGTLFAILSGTIWFSAQWNRESASDRMLRDARIVSREDQQNAAVNTPIPMRLAASVFPEEQGWMEGQIQEFQQLKSVSAEIRTYSDSTIWPSIRDRVTGEDSSLPLLVSLDSRLQMRRLETLYEEKHPDSRLFAREDSLYSTPFVCLMWQDRYFEFQKKYDQLNLRTILQASVDEADWNSIADKPEWGFFRFAMAGFDDDQYGDYLLLLAAHQFLETGEGLSTAQVTDATLKQKLRSLDQIAVVPRDPAGAMQTVVSEAIEGGPEYADVLILSEQAALQALPQLEKKWNRFLQVVYLNPAPLWQRTMGITPHPSSEQRDGANTFLNVLLSKDSMQEVAQAGFRPASGGVSPFDVKAFSRYRLRGVQENLPASVPLPSAEVVDQLRETLKRVRLQE